MNQLPIIDLAAPASQCALKIHEALLNCGFFYVTNHGVSSQLQAELIEIARAFFAEDPAVKMRVAMEHGGLAWRGYFPPGGELTSGRADRKEGLYFGRELDPHHPLVQAKLPLHGPNQWPNDRMRDLVLEYMNQATQLGHRLMELIALSLDLPQAYFRARFSSDPTILFRIFNYQKHVWEAKADEWGVREHTDYGFLTLLRQDESGGLQVKGEDETWIEAPPIDGTLVINIGDMLEYWTHGIYKATPHRVRNQGAGDRISMPFFFDPGWHAPLEQIDRDFLPERDLDGVSKRERRARWDALNLEELTRDQTYGDFLWKKVAKVFPELAQAED